MTTFSSSGFFYSASSPSGIVSFPSSGFILDIPDLSGFSDLFVLSANFDEFKVFSWFSVFVFSVFVFSVDLDLLVFPVLPDVPSRVMIC